MQSGCENLCKERYRPFASVAEKSGHLFLDHKLKWVYQKHDLSFSPLEKNLVHFDNNLFNLAIY